MKYLHGTKQLYLTLNADEIDIIKWYVDASYATQDDYRGHTGAVMTFGEGNITHFFHKQEMNAKSYTEVELIGVEKALSQIL